MTCLRRTRCLALNDATRGACSPGWDRATDAVTSTRNRRQGVGVTASTRSLPSPLSVVRYNTLPGPSCAARNRPKAVSAEGRTTLWSWPELKCMIRTDWSFRKATASAPFQLPHHGPFNHAAPLGARVGLPDDHSASIWRPGNAWLVIGGDSL